jgi:hypothetical protein
MKNILTVSIIAIFSLTLFAQDNVGIGTLNPNTKAILDLTATDKGFLAPRLNTNERINIAPGTSEEGLLVFDTDLNFYFFWDGAQWVQLPGANGFNSTFTFNNNILSITDGGGTLSVPLNFVNNDNDSTNELITNVVFDANGNILTIEEGGNTWSTAISVNDADPDPTNELITNVTFNPNGNVLTIEEGGNTFTTNLNININDADSDPTNELQNLSLSGNILAISGGNSVNLSTFANTDNQTLTLNGTQLSISNGNTVDLSSLAAGDAWKLTGNAGTNVTTNYIGTSDAIGLSIRTNATERIRITANTGFVGIGQTPSYPLDILGHTRITLQNGSIGNANESQLELYNNNSGDVYISFHKGNVWGAHFGLDATNWFSTYGWSAGAGYTNLRVGSFQANGSAQVTNLGGSGNVPVYADNNGILYKGTGVNAPVQIYSFTFPTQNSSDPVPLQDFTTNIPVANYDCVLAEFSSSYDINENSRRRRKMWLYQNADGNWHLSIDFGAHSNNNPNLTNTDVKCVCYIKSMTNWNGNARTLNNNY